MKTAILILVSIACATAQTKLSAKAEKCNPKGFIGSMTCGATCVVYKCSPAGVWVVDEEATMKQLAETERREKDRSDLYWALRSRVLTDEEMNRVKELGKFLVVSAGFSYDAVEVERILNEALLQQFRLRIAANCDGKR